ncbi:MAG TPA: MarR family transcriptional regulator [Longimicrobiaceae bacterium]|nr:MarR family transcriptional regulator [Longimicrobiaceae bacterium]
MSNAPESEASGGGMAQAAEFHRTLQDLIRLHQARDRERVVLYDVTPAGARAIELLERLGAVSLNALATELFVDKSTASRVVGSLESAGLVRRVVDAHDRRALRLELTAEGVELARQLHADAVWEMNALLSSFEPDARRDTLAFLRRLTRTSAIHAGATQATCCRDPEDS